MGNRNLAFFPVSYYTVYQDQVDFEYFLQNTNTYVAAYNTFILKWWYYGFHVLDLYFNTHFQVVLGIM